MFRFILSLGYVRHFVYGQMRTFTKTLEPNTQTKDKIIAQKSLENLQCLGRKVAVKDGIRVVLMRLYIARWKPTFYKANFIQDLGE